MKKSRRKSRPVKARPELVMPMSHQPSPPCRGFLYTVQRGDTLFIIANRFRVSLEDLIAANPQLQDPSRIFPGRRICIPREKKPTPPPPPAKCSGFIYTVRAGDTLFLIAQRNNITLQQLINANPQIKDPSEIVPGQRICIPAVTPPQPPKCSGFIYTVRPGDSLFLIAQRNNIPLQQLIAANPQIQDPSQIFPGQRICVPAVKTPPPPACTGFIYTVRPGDTLFLIAQRNNITLQQIIAANPQITDPNQIMPGQQICVPR